MTDSIIAHLETLGWGHGTASITVQWYDANGQLAKILDEYESEEYAAQAAAQWIDEENKRAGT